MNKNRVKTFEILTTVEIGAAQPHPDAVAENHADRGAIASDRHGPFSATDTKTQRREDVQVVRTSIRANSCIGAFVALAFASPHVAATEADDAERNRKIVSCYADMAKRAYDPPGQKVCDLNSQREDTRNGMGQWSYSYRQSDANGNIVDFWERTSSNGTRKEIAIANKGSVSAGDWVRDVQSQFHVTSPPLDNAISKLGSAPNIVKKGVPKFNAGFTARANNLSSEINSRIESLEDWQRVDPARTFNVKLVGHSLGAATTTILFTYVADRLKSNDKAGVEGFAFNSPKVGNEDMADTIRAAATDCKAGLHVFNNAADVVSMMPTQSNQVYGGAHTTGLSFPEARCVYQGSYNMKGSTGMHVPSAFHPLGIALSKTTAFALDKHDVNQWIKDEPKGYLKYAINATAAKWIPKAASFPAGRAQVIGIFDANVYNPSSAKYMDGQAYNSVKFGRSLAQGDSLFRFIPGDSDCVRHGGTVGIMIRHTPDKHYVRISSTNDVNTGTAFHPDEENTFVVINHTTPVGCIANGDTISLRTNINTYLTASPYAQAHATTIGGHQKFTVNNIHNATTIPERGKAGWAPIPGTLKQVSVGFQGQVWGINPENKIFRLNKSDATSTWIQVPGSLKQISAGVNNIAWGVNSDNVIFYTTNSGQTWNAQGGSSRLLMVSVGADGEVWGLGTDAALYRKTSTGIWEKRTSGAFSHVSVLHGNEVWAITYTGQIQRWIGDDTWEFIPSPRSDDGNQTMLIQLSVGQGGEVWGVNASGHIYRYNDPGWTRIPGVLKYISSGLQEEVWGVTLQNQIARQRNH